MKDRIVSIDIARAICIVLVVVGHYFPDGSPEWYAGLRSWIYSFHMPVFMFLSGYVYQLTQSGDSYASFLEKKARRLLIPYLFVSILIILIKICSQSLMQMQLKNPVGWDSLYKILFRPEAAVHLWFIIALWWIFVIVPFFKSKVSHILLLAVGLVLHFLPEIAPQVHYPEIFCLNYSAGYLLFFALGIVTKDSGLTLSGPRVVLPVLLSAVFIANSIFEISCPLSPFIGIAGILGISALIGRLPSVWISPLIVLSRASYTIYLVHSIFLGFIVTGLKAAPQLLDVGGRYFPVGVVVIVSLCVLCCVAVYYLYKRLASKTVPQMQKRRTPKNSPPS